MVIIYKQPLGCSKCCYNLPPARRNKGGVRFPSDLEMATMTREAHPWENLTERNIALFSADSGLVDLRPGYGRVVTGVRP